jgi:nucleotide-binding universal stress UspA family protein
MTAASLALNTPPSPGSPQVILLATDFCAPSQCALTCARHIAHLRGASVRALHVMDLTGTADPDHPSFSVVRDSAQSRLRDIRRELRLAGVAESATLVTAGRPAQAIRRAATQYHASLLILGVNGSRSRKASTLGSTARSLLGYAPCPVLTVRPPCAESPPKNHCATDRPFFVIDTAPESLRAALAAWPPLTDSLPLRAVLPPNGERGLQIDPDIARRFAPARVLPLPQAALNLLREASETSAGLIVLALRAGGYLDSFVAGSVAHALITQAPCPVLTVRC